MGEIVLVGLGLNDDRGISLRGLDEAKRCDQVFLEAYTSVMPDLSLDRLSALCGKRVQVMERKDFEERSGRVLLDAAVRSKVVLLVPGDPLIATTHNVLRIEAAKRGIQCKIVHGASVFSSVIGLSGLHSYKFGKTVTVPFPSEVPADTPYRVIADNRRLGLHTLCLLDIKIAEGKFLGVAEALKTLLSVEERMNEGVVTGNSLVVVVGRAGSDDVLVKAGFVKNLLSFDFGAPPFSVVFVGELHFTEAEALVVLDGAPEKVRSLSK